MVTFHIPLFCGPALQPLLRTAVPVFFIITGYFLYSADRSVAIARCKKSLRKLLTLFLWSNTLYFIYYLLLGQFPIGSWRGVVRFLVFGDAICFVLWYLMACIQTLVVFWAALKFNMTRWLYPIIPVGLLFALLFGRYCILDHPLPIPLVRNAFTTGIPCFLIGWLTHRYADCLKMRWIEIALLVSTGLYYAEYGLNPLLRGLYAMTVPTAWLLFLCALKHKNVGAGTPLERIGRDHSANIYVLHILVWRLLFHFCPNMLSALMSPQIAAITVFVATLATSVCLKYLHRCLKGQLSLKNI